MPEHVLSTAAGGQVSIGMFGISLIASLILGGFLALLHTYKNTASRNFILTLIVLPAMVQSVIMLVNGSLGTGVAVMGAFGLVRFRSVPGNSREISSIILAMGMGLAAGMGYLGIAVLILAVIGGVMAMYLTLPFGEGDRRRRLKVVIPEDLDYSSIFDDIFRVYTKSARLEQVKTVNMGSLYQLCYQIELYREDQEKELLDEIRCRNGNLEIVCGREAEQGQTL